MAGAVNFHHLVKPADLVVGSVDPGQQRHYRHLVLAVPPSPRSQCLGLGQEFKTAHPRHVDVGEDQDQVILLPRQ